MHAGTIAGMPHPPPLPPAALQPPSDALAGCVRAYVWRDLAALPPTAPCDTRVPAGPYPGLTWLVRGSEVIATGINEIHKVEPGDIAFSDVKKYFEKI